MRIVQFEIPGAGRRVGVVVDSENEVCDVTSVCSDWLRVIDVFQASERVGCGLRELLADALSRTGIERLDYASLLKNGPLADRPFLHLPVDHPDPHWTLVSGTGLTHLGSMQSRDAHGDGIFIGGDDRFQADVCNGGCGREACRR